MSPPRPRRKPRSKCLLDKSFKIKKQTVFINTTISLESMASTIPQSLQSNLASRESNRTCLIARYPQENTTYLRKHPSLVKEVLQHQQNDKQPETVAPCHPLIRTREFFRYPHCLLNSLTTKGKSNDPAFLSPKQQSYCTYDHAYMNSLHQTYLSPVELAHQKR